MSRTPHPLSSTHRKVTRYLGNLDQDVADKLPKGSFTAAELTAAAGTNLDGVTFDEVTFSVSARWGDLHVEGWVPLSAAELEKKAAASARAAAKAEAKRLATEAAERKTLADLLAKYGDQ